ncbi:MAG: hypothetical protein H6741_31005 [Alphaproteobacteria bacterium]|nr:hypothetical protein [Alphaproteobacteria bacterium]
MLLLLLTLGCAPVVSRTSGAVVTGSLSALEDPDNQARVRALLNDPAVAEAAQRLAEATLSASLDTLTDDERAALLQRRSEAFVSALAPRLAAVLQSDLGPAVRAELVAAVQEAALGLTREPVRADLLSFVSAMSAAVTNTVGARLWASAGPGLEVHVGPAAATVLREQLGPALAEVLSAQLLPLAQRDLPPLVAQTARQATREMLQEVTLALQGELGETLRQDRDGMFAQVDAMVAAREDAAEAWFRSMALIAGVLAVATSVFGALWWRSTRESARRLATVELVTGVIKDRAAQDPATRELARAVRDTGRDTAAGDWLSGFLDEKKHLKVDLGDPPPAPPTSDR